MLGPSISHRHGAHALVSGLFVCVLAACGGGGGDGGGAAPPPPPPPPAPTLGLTVTGAGAGQVGGAFNQSSTLAIVGGPVGPNCTTSGGTTQCSSSLQIVWSESSSEHLAINLMSFFLPSPGVQPGTNVNGVSVQFSATLQTGFRIDCVPNFDGSPGCNIGALGISVDTAARRVSFVNTPVPSAAPGGPAAVLNGTLAY